MAITKRNPILPVTTTQILSLAYCTIFGITTDRGNGIGRYYDQYANGKSCIDYAHFDGDYETPFDEDNDYFEAVTESGSEGCWIRVVLVHMAGENYRERHYERKRVGTIKTLDEGRTAWQNMGALAGELAYVANYDAAYKVLKRAKELAAENETAPDHSGNA